MHQSAFDYLVGLDLDSDLKKASNNPEWIINPQTHSIIKSFSTFKSKKESMLVLLNLKDQFKLNNLTEALVKVQIKEGKLRR